MNAGGREGGGGRGRNPLYQTASTSRNTQPAATCRPHRRQQKIVRRLQQDNTKSARTYRREVMRWRGCEIELRRDEPHGCRKRAGEKRLAQRHDIVWVLQDRAQQRSSPQHEAPERQALEILRRAPQHSEQTELRAGQWSLSDDCTHRRKLRYLVGQGI